MDLEQLREWPKEIVLKLFELVKPHRNLYDPNDEQWLNNKLKGKTWNMIAKKLDPNLSSCRCRRKFVALKRRFTSEIKRQMAKGEADFDINLLWLLDQSDDIIDQEKENNLFDLFKMEKNPNESLLEEIFKRIEEAQNPTSSASESTPSTSVGSVLSTETDDIESVMRRKKRKNPAPKKVVSEEPAAKKISSEFTVSSVAAPKLICPQPVRPPVPPKLSISLQIPPTRPMAPRLLSHEQSLIRSPPMPKLIPIQQPTIPRPSSHSSTDPSPRPVRSEEPRMVEEECNTVGRLVELDLRRLRPENRAIARVSIARIIAELITQQVSRQS